MLPRNLYLLFFLFPGLFLYLPFTGAEPESTYLIPDLIPEPPGHLYDVGGYKLHLNCQGSGQPVILIDSGVGGFSLEWQIIQRELSVDYRVCTYDRAGYGWSDIGPMPRTTKRIASELHILLGKAAVQPPFIFLGHSFGGYTALYFAENYSEDIAGVVLIDSSHPRQSIRLTAKYIDDDHTSIRSINSYKVIQPALPEHYPDEFKVLARKFTNSWKSVMTLRDEMKNFSNSGRQIEDSAAILNIPLVVLSRGRRVWPEDTSGEAKEKIWSKLQLELANYSKNSSLIIAEKSGHHIHLDQPDLVVRVTRDLIASITDSQPIDTITCGTDKGKAGDNNYPGCLSYISTPGL